MKVISILSAVGSQIGNVRENNEDNFYYNGVTMDETTRENPNYYNMKNRNKLQIYAVCDGMGGEAYGELASLIAVKTLTKYQRILSDNTDNIDEIINKYIIEASDLIFAQTKLNGGKRLGTTLALVCIVNKKIYIYNVGDSRIYLLRGNKLSQVSEDHTQASRFVKMGRLSAEEAKRHPSRNKLIQYMGISSQDMIIKPAHQEISIKNNDIIFICSDGVTDMIEDNVLGRILNQKKSESGIINDIMIEAKQNGGKDNITALFLRFNIKHTLF